MPILYSVRMRASQQDQHISGGETIVTSEELTETVTALQQKAWTHSRGIPDASTITIEKIEEPIEPIRILRQFSTFAHNLNQLPIFLRQCRISNVAAQRATYILQHVPLRGAALLDAVTGERLDPFEERGVRVTKIGWHPTARSQWERYYDIQQNERIAESVLLASAVASCPSIVGELCISDDPHYTTGYFASSIHGYIRFHKMKEKGSLRGGRVFFVQPHASIDSIIERLQRIPMLATAIH